MCYKDYSACTDLLLTGNKLFAVCYMNEVIEHTKPLLGEINIGMTTVV